MQGTTSGQAIGLVCQQAIENLTSTRDALSEAADVLREFQREADKQKRLQLLLHIKQMIAAMEQE